jgi:dihydroorotate dehydrogenase (fumarate)
MIDLSVKYAGLNLKSPIIVSSSGLTNSVARIEKIAKEGAGAVVLKSLFEEQILFEISEMESDSDYPEAGDYLRTYARENSIKNYLQLITKSKAAIKIPVIASVNCHTSDEWVDFTVQMEEAGADAIELNIFYLANDKKKNPRDYESVYLDILTAVKGKVSIPVIVKLGSHFTNLTWMVDQLYQRGAAAVVLFNRFYAPDISTDDLTMGSAEIFSTPAEIRNSLRWVGIISSEVEKIDIAASTGVHSASGAVKQLLAGANAVQVCSVLYKNGVHYISKLTSELKDWMEKKQYRSIDEFRGKMNYSNIDNPEAYERAQFIKYFSNHQ